MGKHQIKQGIETQNLVISFHPLPWWSLASYLPLFHVTIPNLQVLQAFFKVLSGSWQELYCSSPTYGQGLKHKQPLNAKQWFGFFPNVLHLKPSDFCLLSFAPVNGYKW